MKISASNLEAAQKVTSFPAVAAAIGAVLCLACTSVLLFTAFGALPEDESSIECFSGSTDAFGGSEAYKTALIFALGYLTTLAAKRRHELALNVDKMMCKASEKCTAATQRVASAVSSIGNVRLALGCPSWLSKDVLAILMTAILCFSCIVGLIVSAFMAELDVDPTEPALASEASTTMRVFTVGWMFVLSFKLRRELVGVVGSCCLLQPW